MAFRRGAGIGVLVGAMAGGLLAAQPAIADGHEYTVTTQFVRPGDKRVNIRSAPSVSSSVKRTIDSGTTVQIECQVTGGRLGSGEYKDGRTWDRLVGGGYVHDLLTDTVPADPQPTDAEDSDQLADGGWVLWAEGLEPCADTPVTDEVPQDVAAGWAAAQVGLVSAASEDMTGDEEWYGPVYEWSGQASDFVATAWRRAGVRLEGGTPREQYEAVKADLQTGPAPRGAIVFYPDYVDDGHVAISAGGVAGQETVYSTIGGAYHAVPISRVPIDFFGDPAGWIIPTNGE